jgi:hypothetical protein
MQGPFVNYQDTLMSTTGAVDFFKEARGVVVRLHNISPLSNSLHIYTHWHPRTTKASNCLSGTALRIPAASIPEAVAACHRSRLHITQFLELS